MYRDPLAGPIQQQAPSSTCTEPRRRRSEYRAICVRTRHLVLRTIACLLPDRLAASIRVHAVRPSFHFLLL